MPKRPVPRIIGLGSYLPEKVLTNRDLEKIVDTSDEWIVTRTGMKERRIAAANEYASSMGVRAAKQALADAHLTADKVDLILVATMSPDYISPSTAALIQAELKATNAAAVDLQAACTGYLYGLSMAKAYIESGQYKNVLLIAAEKMSALLDYTDRGTCVLFGDGAAACVIAPRGSGFALGHICLGADGTLCDLLVAPGGGMRTVPTLETVQKKQHFLRMNGKELFKHAVRRMQSAAVECMEKSVLTDDKISWMVPHQANVRIIDALARAMDVPDEKVYKTLHKYGNTSASSIAIALHELTQEHRIKKGENLLLVAFGAGLTWGATILTKV